MITGILTVLRLNKALGLLKAAWAWKVPVLILTICFLSLVIWIQLDKLRRSAENISELNENIRQMERAVALTETLRSRNAELREELHELQESLEEAPSASLPLPDDIRSIVNGLR